MPEQETTTNANDFICNQSVKNGIEQQYNRYLQLLPSLLDILVFSTSSVVSSSIAAKSSSFIIQSPYTPTKLVYITAYSLLLYCTVWFGLVYYSCYSAHHYSRVLCDHFARLDRKRKNDQKSKMGTLSIHRHEASKLLSFNGEGAKKITFTYYR